MDMDITFCQIIWGKKDISKNIMMVNFFCPFDWAIEHPDIWSNIILGVSVRLFLDEIYI